MHNDTTKIMELKDCFKVYNYPESPIQQSKNLFTEWLLKSSNNPKIQQAYESRMFIEIGEKRFKDVLEQIEKETLQEILNILLKEPLADYFWYEMGKLYYSSGMVKDQLLNDISTEKWRSIRYYTIRVDEQKIKIFLRDYKIFKIINI